MTDRQVDRPPNGAAAASDALSNRTIEMTATSEPVVTKQVRLVEEVVLHREQRMKASQ